MLYLWRFVRTIVPLSLFVLWYRRLKEIPQVRSVIKTRRGVEKAYQVTSLEVHPNAFITKLNHARVIAQPIAILGPDYSLLWCFSPQLQRRAATSNSFWKVLGPSKPILGKSFFAAVDGFSYYHWVLGVLPKLLLSAKLQEIDSYIVNPRHKGEENFQTETFKLLQIPSDKVFWLKRGIHVACEQLILPTMPCVKNQTVLEPWARDLILDFFSTQKSDATKVYPEKIYISRAKARRRRILNETEVSMLLMEHGYKPVFLEDLGFLEQMNTLAQAKSIVGLHGAGLANIVFCAQGTRILELTSNLWPNPCFRNIAEVCGLTYRSVQGVGIKAGRASFVADVHVNLADLRKALSDEKL